jgi:protein-disulfide isomerase
MNDQEWVERRLQLLDSADRGTPNVARAFARFEERGRRFRAVRRNWIWGSAVATVACLVMVAVPSKSICCARPEGVPVVQQLPIAPVAAAATPAPVDKAPVPVVVPMPPVPTVPLVCEIYSDFECPACAAFYRDTFPQLEEQYIKTGKVKLVHRDFPLPQHRFALIAARYGEAAREFGVYDAVAIRLYETQSEWGANGNIEASLKAILPQETLDKMRTLAENDPKVDESIARDQTLGADDRINQTPTLVIVTPDGQRHKLGGNPPFATLSAYLDELLQTRK